MRRALFIIGAVALVSAAAYGENRHFNAGVQSTIGVIDPTKVVMKSAPINPDWILEGHPVTTAAKLARTSDVTTTVFIWQTTAGKFHWNYAFDEAVQVIDGEAFIMDETTHIERRLGPGDVAFFPVGARTTWRVPDHIRKFATVKNCLPGPFASMIRWARMARSVLQPESALAGDQSL